MVLISHPSRRAVLTGLGTLVAWSALPRSGFAGKGRDPRLVVVVLRGAVDGLALAPPTGDPDYEALRGGLAIGASGRGGTLPLDGFFALNDAMPHLFDLYRARQALIVHAAATPYRERSHFDGQDVLESGFAGAGSTLSGWLNRAAALLPQGEGVRPVSGLAAMSTVPLILRGDAPTLTWTPPLLAPTAPDTSRRLLDLYATLDPVMAKVLATGIETDRLAGGMPRGGAQHPFAVLAEGSARLLRAEDGPRLAALCLDGWDTHVSEGADDGHLALQLAGLDAALAALSREMASIWDQTVVAVVTEFGRTARANGNDGTDHGTATTALLLGGAVQGGRVIADWPGLRDSDLYEGRDLAPTTDLRSVLKGVLRDHLGLTPRELALSVFPDSLGVRPYEGLIA